MIGFFEQQSIDEFSDSTMEAFEEMRDLLVSKRQSYGPHSLTRFGLTGIVIRASDKIERLVTMAQSGTTENADGDSMEDALKDLIGYGLLGLLYYRMNVRDEN